MEAVSLRAPHSEAPSGRLFTRATCELDDGQVRVWYATYLSASEVYILALRPPPIGTKMAVTLHPRGLPPLPKLTVRVVSTRLDPGNAAGCGFGGLITGVHDGGPAALASALAALGLDATGGAPTNLSAERRMDPRIWMDINARMVVASVCVDVLVINLSMSGALVRLGALQPWPAICAGMPVELDLVDNSAPEAVSLTGTVVRVAEPQGGAHSLELGVQFGAVEPSTEAHLEGMVLRNLGTLPR